MKYAIVFLLVLALKVLKVVAISITINSNQISPFSLREDYRRESVIPVIQYSLEKNFL